MQMRDSSKFWKIASYAGITARFTVRSRLGHFCLVSQPEVLLVELERRLGSNRQTLTY